MLYIGIDPGLSSGIAVYDPSSNAISYSQRVRVRAIAELASAATAAIVAAYRPSEQYLAAIERPWVGTNATVVISLGRQVGVWEACLAHVISCPAPHIIAPSSWRAILSLPGRPRDTAKAAAQQYAHQLGYHGGHTDVADACCIAAALCQLHARQGKAQRSMQ